MPALSITDLTLEKYQCVLEQALGGDIPCAICDRLGNPVFTASAQDQTIGVVLAALNANGFLWEQRDDGIQRRDVDDDKALVYRILDSDRFGTIGAVTALADRSEGNNAPMRRGNVDKTLNTIGDCILTEYSLTQELNEMAEELAARYEELNLVYRTEEQIKKYDIESGHQVLFQLVEDCVDHLGVDVAVLTVPAEELEISRVSDRGDITFRKFQGVRHQLWKGLHQLATDARDSIVLNKMSDPRRANACLRIPIKVLATPVFDISSHVGGVLTIFNDDRKPDFTNSDRKLLEVLAEQVSAVVQAGHDALTGLFNREGLEHRLMLRLRAGQKNGSNHALLHVDIDQLKVVNDTSGHIAGDELIKQIANLLQDKTRDGDIVARLGGDEFVVFLECCPPNQAISVASKLLQEIKDYRFSWHGKLFDTTASIGVVAITPESGDVSDILATADTACSVAKQQGRGRAHTYQKDDAAYAAHFGQMQWVPRLNQALEEDRFELYIQKIVPIEQQSEHKLHYEILLRFIDEQRQIITPFAFIPAAERYQLMPSIDRWVIHNTLARMSSAGGAELAVAINLSGQSFVDNDFIDFVTKELEEFEVSPDRVCFEITETAAISNFSAALNFISHLKTRGCQFSLDDFGSGLSSFSYLKNLPVNYLKIDGVFVKELTSDPVSEAMVSAISQIARLMGIRTIAEFVENEAILERLKQLGVDYAQGYGIGKPRPLRELINPIAPPVVKIAGS